MTIKADKLKMFDPSSRLSATNAPWILPKSFGSTFAPSKAIRPGRANGTAIRCP
jgi:hypothetical protein